MNTLTHKQGNYRTIIALSILLLLLSACGGEQQPSNQVAQTAPEAEQVPEQQQPVSTTVGKPSPTVQANTPTIEPATATSTSTPTSEPVTATPSPTNTSTTIPPTPTPTPTPLPVVSSPDTWIWTSSGPQRFMSTASNTAPDSVDAAGNKVSYDAYNVMDDDPSTAWRVEGDGKGESLLIEFPLDIIRVNALHIIPGYAKIDPLDGTDRFNENRRIQRVRLEFSDGSSIEADLEDSPELQTIPIPEQDTTFIKLVIMETSEHGGRDYTAISSIGVAGKNCLAYCEDMPPDMVPDEETIAAILSDAETTAGYYDLRIDSGYARCMRIPADMRFDPIYSFYQLEGDTWTVLAAGGDPSLPLYIQDMGVPERLWIGQDR